MILERTMEGNEEGDCHVGSAPRNDVGEKVRDDAIYGGTRAGTRSRMLPEVG